MKIINAEFVSFQSEEAKDGRLTMSELSSISRQIEGEISNSSGLKNREQRQKLEADLETVTQLMASMESSRESSVLIRDMNLVNAFYPADAPGPAIIQVDQPVKVGNLQHPQPVDSLSECAVEGLGPNYVVWDNYDSNLNILRPTGYAKLSERPNMSNVTKLYAPSGRSFCVASGWIKESE